MVGGSLETCVRNLPRTRSHSGSSSASITNRRQLLSCFVLKNVKNSAKSCFFLHFSQSFEKTFVLLQGQKHLAVMIIGREKELQLLREAYNDEYSQFVVVYGRRRVGKTFLVREAFNYKFTFQHAGIANAPKSVQLEE